MANLNKNIKRTIVTGIAYILCTCCSPIFSYSISIQTPVLFPDQDIRQSVGVLSNVDGENVLPIKIKVYESKPKDNDFGGKLVETEEIKVLPSTIIVMPGQEKMFQILYKGNKPRKEKVYYIETSQTQRMNKRRTKKKFDVEILMNFQKKVLVSSKKFKDNMYVSAEPVLEEETQKLKLIFENKGTKLKRYRNLDLRIKTTKGNIKLTRNDINEANVVIYPYQRIEKIIDWPQNLEKNASIISARTF